MATTTTTPSRSGGGYQLRSRSRPHREKLEEERLRDPRVIVKELKSSIEQTKQAKSRVEATIERFEQYIQAEREQAEDTLRITNKPIEVDDQTKKLAIHRVMQVAGDVFPLVDVDKFTKAMIAKHGNRNGVKEGASRAELEARKKQVAKDKARKRKLDAKLARAEAMIDARLAALDAEDEWLDGLTGMSIV